LSNEIVSSKQTNNIRVSCGLVSPVLHGVSFQTMFVAAVSTSALRAARSGKNRVRTINACSRLVYLVSYSSDIWSARVRNENASRGSSHTLHQSVIRFSRSLTRVYWSVFTYGRVAHLRARARVYQVVYVRVRRERRSANRNNEVKGPFCRFHPYTVANLSRRDLYTYIYNIVYVYTRVRLL